MRRGWVGVFAIVFLLIHFEPAGNAEQLKQELYDEGKSGGGAPVVAAPGSMPLIQIEVHAAPAAAAETGLFIEPHEYEWDRLSVGRDLQEIKESFQDAKQASQMAEARLGASRLPNTRLPKSRMTDSRMRDSRLLNSRLPSSRMHDSRLLDSQMR